jgi:hypothetical protein
MAMEMRYRVEFYDGSISDEEVVNSFEVTTAPYAFSVGDFVDPSGWGGKNPLPPDEHYQIIAVEHQLSLVDMPEDQQGQHNVAIAMKAVKKE